MYYLSDKIKRLIASKILQAPHTFFFLDFDGTIAPIMPTPQMVKVEESTRHLLEKVVANPNLSIAIITGRKIEEIEALIDLKNLIYAGNHGLELKGPDFNYTHAKVKQYTRIMRDIAETLKPFSELFPGSFLEDKQISLTYHFRLVDPPKESDLLQKIAQTLEPWTRDKKIKVTEAKKAVEIRPNFNWNKGSAVRWFLLHEDPESLPIYIGDDKTDESAFRALSDDGITIRVGLDRNSHAQYFLNDTYEVMVFLAFLSVLKDSKTKELKTAVGL